MSLVAIFEAIRASGELQVREIEKRAREQADEILSTARRDAQRVREGACIKEVLPAYRERARIVHRARLDGLRNLGDVREELIDATLDQVRERLIGIREDPAYPQVLRRITQEALSELRCSLEDVTQAKLELDPRDRELLDSILAQMGLNLPVNHTLHCWGGLVAQSEDGRMVVINTLESRFERASPVLRRYLAALFEQARVDEANLV